MLAHKQRYGPEIDLWSCGCIFAELLIGKPLLPGEVEAQQLEMTWKLCGTPDQVGWESAKKLPLYTRLQPAKQYKVGQAQGPRLLRRGG